MKKVTMFDYGYRPEMTMDELKALCNTLNREQAAELARLIRVAANNCFAQADGLRAALDKRRAIAANYGYRADMTTEELRALAETLNAEQIEELERLIDLEADANQMESDELLEYRDAKFGPQAANS